MADVRKAWALSCVCFCSLLGLVDCGGGSSASRETSGGSGGTSANAGTGGTAGTGRGGAGVGGTAGTATKGCAAPTADAFETKWMPPAAAPDACTADQISRAYGLCASGSPDYDSAACRSFNVDPQNATCLGCLFSTFDAEASGALLVFPGGRWLANVGGCQALLDGDSSAASCGAREQAASLCQYEVCIDACTSNATEQEQSSCGRAAIQACKQYTSETACSSLPRYALCHQATFADYFITLGDLFCGSGLPAAHPEGGAGGAESSAGASGAAGAGGAPL